MPAAYQANDVAVDDVAAVEKARFEFEAAHQTR